jgi:hypothetical protein
MIRRTPIKRGKSPKRKTSARKLKQEIDLLIKAVVLKRDNYRCVASGEAGVKCNEAERGLQAAHILPKGKYPRLRFNTDNVLSMCFYHHLIWAHKDPLDFARFIREAYPGREEKLRILAQTAAKVDLKELLGWLRAEALNQGEAKNG